MYSGSILCPLSDHLLFVSFHDSVPDYRRVRTVATRCFSGFPTPIDMANARRNIRIDLAAPFNNA